MNTRSFDVKRDSVDAAAGTFEAAVFTGGEASDGHILNIQGGRTEDSIPLFINHEADPRSQLGSLHFVRRTDQEMIYRGEVFLDGEGVDGEMRRNLVAMMADGHIKSMSGRWDFDAKDATRRVNLPKNHHAHVSEKSDGAGRFGMFFEKWRAMEGSVVGLGADKAATVRMLREHDAYPEDDSDVVSEESAAERFAQSLADLIGEGMKPEEIIDSIVRATSVEVPDTEPDVAEEIDEDMIRLSAEVTDLTETVRELEAQVARLSDALTPAAVAPEPEPEAAAPASEPEGSQFAVPPGTQPAEVANALRSILEDQEQAVMQLALKLVQRAQGAI